jgi:hypothetical protein
MFLLAWSLVEDVVRSLDVLLEGDPVRNKKRFLLMYRPYKLGCLYQASSGGLSVIGSKAKIYEWSTSLQNLLGAMSLLQTVTKKKVCNVDSGGLYNNLFMAVIVAIL